MSEVENTSGWFPMLHRILVLPEETELAKSVNRAGLIMPDNTDARDQQAQVDGIFIAAGPEAFSDKPNSQIPKVGQRVMFAKLAGFFVQGDDGKKYRMINDLDLVAVHGDKHE